MGRPPKYSSSLAAFGGSFSSFVGVFHGSKDEEVDSASTGDDGAGPVRPPRGRTGTGCVRCKERKVKCDERQPSCRRCVLRGDECSYSVRLLWKTSKTPSHLASKQDQVPPHARLSRPVSFIHFSSDDLGLLCQPCHSNTKRHARLIDDYLLHLSEPPLGDAKIPPSLAPSKNPEDWLDDIDYLYRFMEGIMCPRSGFVDDKEHPYRTAVLPMIAKSEPVRCCVRLLVAHFSKTQKQYRLLETQIYQELLSLVRHSLSTDNCFDDENLLAVIMLSSNSIANSRGPTWLSHLAYYKHVVDRRNCQSRTHLEISPAYQMFTNYFSSHLVIANTMFEVDNVDSYSKANITGLSNFHTNEIIYRATPSGVSYVQPLHSDPGEINLWVGCSPNLLCLIYDITALRLQSKRLMRTPLCRIPSVINDISIEIHRLRNELEKIIQTLPSHSSWLRDPDHHGRRLVQLRAECYRAAAILLLHATSQPSFYGLPTTHVLAHQLPQVPHWRLRECWNLIIESSKEIVIGRLLPISWGLWSLFMAAAYAEEEDDKAVVLNLLTEARQNSTFENVWRAQRLAELLWQWRDTNDSNAKMDHPGRYEWEVVLDILKWNPSLV